MRILYLSQLVPYPLDAGPKVRSYHVLQYLAAAGHAVTLVAFARPSDSQAAVDHLRQYCEAVHTLPMHRSRLQDVRFLAQSLLHNAPFLIARDHVAAMHNLLAQLLATGRYDAIHADQLWMAQYALTAAKGSQIKTVLDQHNATYLIPQRMAESSRNPLKQLLFGMEGRKMASYEVAACNAFDEVVWVTAEDRAAVARVVNGAADGVAGQVIPICVDPKTKPPVAYRPGGKRVTFLGGLHWPPNASGMVWFAREVWPQIVAQVPDAHLTVIGKSPPSELKGLDGKVEILGYVDDPLPYLAETAAFIVPLHAGGGMRVKIIDAWAWGVPIVSTTIGAEGIDYEDGNDLLLADGAAAFGQAVIKLLQTPEEAVRLAANGRKKVEHDYNWHTIYPAWEQVYA